MQIAFTSGDLTKFLNPRQSLKLFDKIKIFYLNKLTGLVLSELYGIERLSLLCRVSLFHTEYFQRVLEKR